MEAYHTPTDFFFMFKVIVYWICLRVSVQRPLSFPEFACVGVYMRLSICMKKKKEIA